MIYFLIVFFLAYMHNITIVLIIYTLSSLSQQSSFGTPFKTSTDSFSRSFDKVIVLRHIRHVSNGDQVKRRVASLHEAKSSLRPASSWLHTSSRTLAGLLNFDRKAGKVSS